ncbi:hypothetical protein GCK72_002625 [Caenorhabditis remanei]|uniref:Uncharacterized protein n=1 Tax=Caenorhabditis remanei TaxID=31234 RepID=A0A6A5HXP9_CAERE|nr:hypothetical protein GCK72_002625 [Caenorhabditis remanei]KAF1770802.1 hypothetical protein GCK72_002625 [Caenorhabditis remanei]
MSENEEKWDDEGREFITTNGCLMLGSLLVQALSAFIISIAFRNLRIIRQLDEKEKMRKELSMSTEEGTTTTGTTTGGLISPRYFNSDEYKTRQGRKRIKMIGKAAYAGVRRRHPRRDPKQERTPSDEYVKLWKDDKLEDVKEEKEKTKVETISKKQKSSTAKSHAKKKPKKEYDDQKFTNKGPVRLKTHKITANSLFEENPEVKPEKPKTIKKISFGGENVSYEVGNEVDVFEKLSNESVGESGGSILTASIKEVKPRTD